MSEDKKVEMDPNLADSAAMANRANAFATMTQVLGATGPFDMKGLVEFVFGKQARDLIFSDSRIIDPNKPKLH